MTTEQQISPVKKFGLINVILILALGALLFGEAWSGYNLQLLSEQREQVKNDYSTINSISFGIFSVDKWRNKLSEIVHGKVGDFNISPAQKKMLQDKVEAQFNSLINSTLAGINKPKKSLLGKIEKVAVNNLVNEDDIHAQVPIFAKAVVDKISSPTSTDRLKNIVHTKINQLESETYDSTEKASNAVSAFIYHKYNVTDSTQFVSRVNSQLTAIKKATYNNLYIMLGCVLAALLLWAMLKNQKHLHATLFVMSLLLAFVLLYVGVSASIIEVDAQLKTFNLSLMGENIAFNDQVLFFQSKSILEIIQTLVSQAKPDTVAVGVLVMLFVIILPVVRILARGIHILGTKKVAENKVVRYMAFSAAKWDMSDVMIVGILMTYIGLNGILKNELSNLDYHNSLINSNTLNNSSLQPGYYVFVAYVVFTIILAAILKRITPHDGIGK